jgi:hypothetical protein
MIIKLYVADINSERGWSGGEDGEVDTFDTLCPDTPPERVVTTISVWLGYFEKSYD